MKTKTINIVLCRKFDAFLKSITDSGVRALVAENTIITGGCITSMLLKEKVSDYDFYFRSFETAFAVANYFKRESVRYGLPVGSPDEFEIRSQEKSECGPGEIKLFIKSSGIWRYTQDDSQAEELDEFDRDLMQEVAQKKSEEAATERPEFSPVFMSSAAMTLTNKVQLVFRFFGDPDEIHANYDFVHCTNFWDSKTRLITLKAAALECILTKELRYIGSRFPLCSVMRVRKFIERGWTINAGQILKMAMQISVLDLSNTTVLQDQLVGVDSAYFSQIISDLQERGKDQVDTGYLMNLIEKIF